MTTVAAAAPRLELTVESGTVHQFGIPVSIHLDLRADLGATATASRLRLTELGSRRAVVPDAVPAQFEPDTLGSTQGTLWWLLPPGGAEVRRFVLSIAPGDASAAFRVTPDARRIYYDVAEGDRVVLRYNHGTVPVPSGVGTNYARGDYIMPLFGPSGETLTDDYPKDHPHHRGIGWSWPVTRWGDEVRDIWAVVGVWARPVAMRRAEAGPVFAVLEAENVWKWSDITPIVREEVLIRAFRQTGDQRCVDVEVRLTALAENVAIGGRPHGGYGGFGLRAQPAQERVITSFTDPPDATPRRCWLDYSGRFAGGQGPAGIAILEHPTNPLYPSELKVYPELNYVMPAFPGEREVPLRKDQPLVLRHRLWVHAGMAGAPQLGEVWAGYAHPPKAQLAK